MPGRLSAVSKANSLSYEVNAVRCLLIRLPTNLGLAVGVLTGSTAVAITVASMSYRDTRQMVTRERQHADPGEDSD
jgi:hypothetical protein